MPRSGIQWFELLYHELRRIARGELFRYQTLTLGPSTVLHEAWLRIGGRPLEFASQAELIGYASRVMRSIVIDHLRERNAQKRGRDFDRVTYETLADLVANNLDSQGRLPESLDAYRKALRIKRDILGDAAVPVASWTNLGRTLARLNQFEEAWTVTVRGLEAARRSHDGIAQFYGPITLANIRREQRRFAEAREQLAVATQHLGDEKPGSTLHSSLDLSIVTVTLAEGHAAQALTQLDRLDADVQRYERENHTHEVTDVFSQRLTMVRADVLAELGRMSEALSAARRSVELARRQQGPTPLSADTAAALSLVARLQARAGDMTGAAATAREAAPLLTATYGPTHPLTLKTRALSIARSAS